MSLDYRAYPVLYVDDEAANLVTMHYVLDDQFTLLTTTSTAEALKLLAERDDIAVLIADQRMPEMTGAELCARAVTLRPDAARLIVTAYADLHMAMDAINRGQVSRYLAKPWRVEELVDVVRTAIDLVAMQRTIRELELRLVRTGPQAAVGALNAEIAHELANPLQCLTMTIQLMGDLLQAADKTSEQGRVRDLLRSARESHVDAEAAVEQLTALVRRLRARPPSRPPPADRTDVARVVESTVRIVRSEVQRVGTLGLIVDAAPRVAMDSTALGQIVVNLLLNAVQAVEQRESADHRITVRVTSDATDAIIEVADTGPGISPEARDRIFDPFYTTKSGGSGLGLAIVRDLLSRDAGRISVTSNEVGATFVVRIPRAKD